MSASGEPGWDTLYRPMAAGFHKARFNDIESVRRVLGRDTVAVMLELVQGEAGANPGGRRFAHQHFGVQPDIITLAKGLGGGVPLAALPCTEWLNCFENGDQSSTYCGNPLMAEVGLAVLNAVSRDTFLAQVQARAQQLSAGLQAIVRDHGLVAERGVGMNGGRGRQCGPPCPTPRSRACSTIPARRRWHRPALSRRYRLSRLGVWAAEGKSLTSVEG